MELATGVCVKNLKGLESIGDYLPYEAVRHILLKIDSAYQLRQVELNSPQIQGETGEIWLKIIEKDFPLEYKAKAYKPQNADKWYRVWEKYKKDHDTALQESENKLKNALAGLRQDKEKNTSRIVERKFLPRAGRVGPKKTLATGPRESHSNVLSFNAGSRTKTINGASVMRKVRREVKEIATIHGALSKPIRGPTRLSHIHKAPASMMNDYRRAAQPQFRTSARASELPSAVEEHEERATFISDSEEDDDEGSFDEPEMPKAASKPTKSHVAQSAATSLLKRKATSFRTGQASASSARPSKPSQSSSASETSVRAQPGSSSVASPTKRGASSLANKFRSPVAKSQAAPSPSSPQPKIKAQTSEPPKPAQYLPRTQTSPPLPAAAGPSSPPAIERLPPATLAVDGPPRKRKAVDVFMRPKKRL